MKKEKRGLKNLVFLKVEAKEFLEVLPPHVRLEETLLIYPDPWPKKRHHKHRLVQAAFLDQLAARSESGARFCLRTDHEEYFAWTQDKIEAHPAWILHPGLAWPFEHETYFQSLLPSHRSLLAVRKEIADPRVLDA